jgi:hypothetical protein
MVATVCAIVLIPNVTATASFLVKEDRRLIYLGKHPWVVKPSRGKRRARLSERTTFREAPGSFLAPSIQPPMATMVLPLRP